MPGFFTDFANNKILDLVFGAAIYTPPPTLYVGLATNASNKSGLVTEPSGGGYARVPIANNTTNFPISVGGTKSNAVQVSFSSPTANWGTIQSIFVSDAPSGGNVLAMADLAAPKAITSGSVAAKVAVGALFLSHT
jgi:hypothetical protein